MCAPPHKIGILIPMITPWPGARQADLTTGHRLTLAPWHRLTDRGYGGTPRPRPSAATPWTPRSAVPLDRGRPNRAPRPGSPTRATSGPPAGDSAAGDTPHTPAGPPRSPHHRDRA